MSGHSPCAGWGKYHTAVRVHLLAKSLSHVPAYFGGFVLSVCVFVCMCAVCVSCLSFLCDLLGLLHSLSVSFTWAKVLLASIHSHVN